MWKTLRPADLDLHCFQWSLYLVSYCFNRVYTCRCLSTVRAWLSSLSIIYFLRQVKLPVDKYLITIYLSLRKYQLLLFPHQMLQNSHVQINHVQISHVQINHVQINHVQTSHVQINPVQISHVQINQFLISHVQINHVQINHVQINHDKQAISVQAVEVVW